MTLSLNAAQARRALLLALTTGCSISGHAATTTDELEEIIVTGTKGDFGLRSGIPLIQVPQAVQVFAAEDLSARNVRSIGDVLRSVPSGNPGNPRTSSYQSFSLKIRGFLPDQMRNGVRQRYYEDVDASNLVNIERIEVLKGPSSVLFGQSALGGIISIITKRPEREFSAEVSALVGSFDQKLASFDITGPVGEHLSLRANGEVERSGTYVDFQDIDRENAAFAASWVPSDELSAHLVTEWNERRTQRNTGLPIVGTVRGNGVRPIPVARFLGDPGRSDLEASSPLLQGWLDVSIGGGWTVSPRISYSQLKTDFTELRVRDVRADGVTVNRTGRYGREDDDYLIGQVDLTGTVSLLGIQHSILAGIEYNEERTTFVQEDIVDNDGNSLVPTINSLAPVYGVTPRRPYAFAYLFEGDVDGIALYVQDRIDVTERWNIVAGARWSDFDTRTAFSDDPVIDTGEVTRDSFDHTTFQLGTSYRIGAGWSAFGGYATGFDIENVAGSRDAAGNPLDPEEAEQLEAGLRYTRAGMTGSVSAFEISRINVATADPVNDGYSIQTGEIRVRGAEIEGTVTLAQGLTLQGGYAYLDSEIVSSNEGDQGDDVTDVPEHQANMFLRWQVPGTGLELRGGANYVGERRFSNARVEVAPGLLASDVRLPDHFTVDLGAAYTRSATRVDLALTNVLDERYFTVEFNDYSVLPGEPFQVSLRLTQSF